MVMPRLQVIGGGKMGEALLAGLVAGGWAAADEIRVVERLAGRADELAERFPRVAIADTVGPADGHVLAVKPGDVETACRALAGAGDGSPVLSIAAGVTVDRLEAALAPGTPVVRAMPNTPALVGEGAAAVAAGTAAGDEDLAWAERILGAVGKVVRVDESTEGPEALRAAVTSPGGTTAAGLRALEAGAVRASFLDAIMAATERSRELGS